MDDGDVVDCRDIAPTLRTALAAGTVPGSAPDAQRYLLFEVKDPPLYPTEKIICIA